MAHYILEYHLAPDYLQRRPAFREEHLELAWRFADRGELILGGALGDTPTRALLLFDADGPEVVRSFATRDPYVREGLVLTWQVERWATVVGDNADDTVRPT